MKKETREYRLYLQDMITSSERIAEYIEGISFYDFVAKHLITDAVIRNLEIIGEASNKIPKEIKSKFPDLPWDKMYRLRNIVSHDYFIIDYEIVWEIITKELPSNKIELENILIKLGN